MTALKTNERLLYEILNDAWPKQWVSEYTGIEAKGIYKSEGKFKDKEYTRRFRFDCANPSQKIAIEIEGGIWLGNKGGHTNGIGYDKNMLKYNLATIEGWKILRYSPDTLKKRPYVIIRDIRMLCGASLNDEGQSILCFDDVSVGKTAVQVKIS